MKHRGGETGIRSGQARIHDGEGSVPPREHGSLMEDGAHVEGGTRAEKSTHALCIWLPTFELRLEILRSPDLDETSVALLEPDESERRKVWQVSERAWESGVRPGVAVSEAVGLCPDLTLLEPDPTHYDVGMESLLEALAEMSPVLEPSGRGRIFVGTDGLDRLHGSPERQVERALHILMQILPRPLVAAVRAGWAPGRFGAWVAAVAAQPGRPTIVFQEELASFLATRPVSSLPGDPSVARRLERLGVHTLGDVSRIPEDALVRHFGPEARKVLGWATGRRLDPVRAIHRPRPIRASLDFPSPVGLTSPLHGAVERLIERILARPARRGRSIRGIRIRARLEEGGSWSTEVTLREPTARKDDILSPLRSKLELSPPPRAVEGLALEAFEFGPSTSQPGLFPRRTSERGSLADGEVPPSLREAVRELKLKLGHSPLYRVVEMDPWSRIPERRHALLGFDP